MVNPAVRPWRFRLRRDSLLGGFLFEFAVVVSGVLMALALNAWFEDRQDAKTEAGYLVLLSRDLERTICDLTTFTTFEARQIEDAALVQRSIARLPPAEDPARLSEAMARLLTRHTMVLKNSAYLDLVSTGHLNLIHDPALRDAIVDFYQMTSQRFEVINRNNEYFVDHVYNTNVIMSRLLVSTMALRLGGERLEAAHKLAATIAAAGQS